MALRPSRLVVPVLVSWMAASPLVESSAAQDEEMDPELAEIARLVRDNFAPLVRRTTTRLDREFGEGTFEYRFDDDVVPRPYVFAIQPSDRSTTDDLAREYAEVFSFLRTYFTAELGEILELGEMKRPIVVLVFDSEEAYRAIRDARPELGLLDPDRVGGYFDPQARRLVLWRQPYLYTVLFHEGTHQLIDYAAQAFGTRQVQESPWFQEGFADLMGGWARVDDGDGPPRFELARFAPHRFRVLAWAREEDELFTVRQLVEMNQLGFQSLMQSKDPKVRRRAGLVYAQGWALSMYLWHADDAENRDAFKRFIRLETEGKGSDLTFADTFRIASNDDWHALDADHRAWVFDVLPTLPPMDSPNPPEDG